MYVADVYFTLIFTIISFAFSWHISRDVLGFAITRYTQIWVPLICTIVFNAVVKKTIVYKMINRKDKAIGPHDFIALRRFFHAYDL